MLKFLKRSLTPQQLEEIEERVIQEAEAGRDEAALRELQPLISISTVPAGTWD